ncbi:MAG: hypothetical protein Q9191_007933 [Dirinaria sp. TL-2023a]
MVSKHPGSRIIVSPTETFHVTRPDPLLSPLPGVIVPSGGKPDQPPNTTTVQVGFSKALNYPFVVANTLSQRQIFKYLPSAVAYGLIIDMEMVVMKCLRAYDTGAQLNYITTLALLYIPSDRVDIFAAALLVPNNSLYRNPDASSRVLMSLINPAIPVRPESASASATSASATISSPSGLNSNSKIGVGIAIPLAIVAFCILGVVFWRKRRSIHRNATGIDVGERKSKNAIFELSAEAKTSELPVGNHSHEMSAEERKEMEGDLRRRQELVGSDFIYEFVPCRDRLTQ